MKRTKFACTAVTALMILCSIAVADDQENNQPQGLLPIPHYSGSITERSYLSGDWDGKRDDLARQGLQFNLDWTQTLQKIASGGRDRSSGYGNTLDYNMSLDLMRMGVLPGALLTFRAESLFGESVNGDSGSILPTNTDMLFPIGSGLDDDIDFTITSLSLTQFLSERFAFTFGKFDTLDADLNEFASGRGTTQFMDGNFLFNSTLALRIPYSALGGGFIVMPVPPGKNGGVTLKSVVTTTTDSSERPGFDTFDDGLSWTTELNTQYRLGSLPGGQNLGFLYSFDQAFKEIDGRLVIRPGEGLVIPQEDSTWAAYWSMWQYLVVKDKGQAPIDLANKTPDHRGFGVFARAGVADHDTNPAKWSMSGGVGGRGVGGRPDDMYGVGYYYTRLQKALFLDALNIEDHAQGLEAYYNIAITPAAQLTIDLQSVHSVLAQTDAAFIVGGRFRVLF